MHREWEAPAQVHDVGPGALPKADVSMELVGVTHNTLKRQEQTWWKADGSELAQAPYQHPYVYSNETIPYEFAFRVRDDDGFNYSFKGPANKSEPVQALPLDAAQKHLPNLRSVVIGRFTPDETTAMLRVGVATGKWDKVDEWRDYRWKDTNGTLTNPAQIVFKWPTQRQMDVVTEITHTYVDDATRLVAFDRKGKLHESVQTTSGEGKGLIQKVCSFRSISLDDIQRFEFQKRPYDIWYTLTDISLMPGHRTKPQTKRE